MPPARTAAKPSRGAKPPASKSRSKPKPKPKAGSRARARRSAPMWRPRLPVVEQRHLDLAGLGLVAAGVFLAFPLYL
ncbi:MAG: segregation ATPase FtsK/SpoIIIE, family, partial [Solirubrobacteraceae bacterium]|nr:segregation ATPase FtsK/SpoIIIE, family [Solirubrobacteraceae bacterium]